MGIIRVINLTYSYEKSAEKIFDKVNIELDSDWKLALIGRNGRGKTTLLKLLQGCYQYTGKIESSESFKYYPYCIDNVGEKKCYEIVYLLEPEIELWKVDVELNKLNFNLNLFEKKYCELSPGEQAKLTLAILFSSDNHFFLIDEPTNHLDIETKEIIARYLSKKKGFIIVSHDRMVIDKCADHILALNKSTIEVQKGNLSTWFENKKQKDVHELDENEKLKKEIVRLKESQKKIANWAKTNEDKKIGYDPIKEHDRGKDTRGYIGAKTKKANKRITALGERIEREINEKKILLKDVYSVENLKINYIESNSKVMLEVRKMKITYKQEKKSVISEFSMSIFRGECVFLKGKNGTGKSSILKSIVNSHIGRIDNKMSVEGIIKLCSELKISYIPQRTEWGKTKVEDLVEIKKADKSIFFTTLSKLGLNPKDILLKTVGDLSNGEQKKVQLALSLTVPANLYIWDEPFNYLDIDTRQQIEELIKKIRPTMLIVDHDKSFIENCSTRVIEL